MIRLFWSPESTKGGARRCWLSSERSEHPGLLQVFQSYHKPRHRVGVFADQYHTGELDIALGGEEVDIINSFDRRFSAVAKVVDRDGRGAGGGAGRWLWWEGWGWGAKD